jgi:DNA polymerase-4
LSNYAYQLFEKLYQRRQLVRLVGVKMSHLVNGNYQINLFDDTLKEIRLMEQMDKVRKRFGTKAILKAATL